MKQLQTKGIVLSRTNYGEADRIIVVLTPDFGKLRLMARGVRKEKSKLAGGVELFSVSDFGFIKGRGEIDTLISSRLTRHYGQLVNDLSRVQLGYELIKIINRATEDQPEEAYFNLLNDGLAALNEQSIDLDLIASWFKAQLIKQAGHSPNLLTDIADNPLSPTRRYNFDADRMAFSLHPKGRFGSHQIKSLRLLFSDYRPAEIQNVAGLIDQLAAVSPLVQAMLTSYIRV